MSQVRPDGDQGPRDKDRQRGKGDPQGRECPGCMNRFTTYERLEDRPVLWIVKKSGQREAFDREKLLKVLPRPAKSFPSRWSR